MVFYFAALLLSLALAQLADADTIYVEADVDNRIFTPSAVQVNLGDTIDIQSRGTSEWGFVEAVGYDAPCTETQQPRIQHLYNITTTAPTDTCPSLRITQARFVVRDISASYVVFALGQCRDGMVLAVNLSPDQTLDVLQGNARGASDEVVSGAGSCLAAPLDGTHLDSLYDSSPRGQAESPATYNMRLALAIAIPLLVAIAAAIWFYTDYRRKRRQRTGRRPYMRQQDSEMYSFPLPPLEEAPIYTRTDVSATPSTTTRTPAVAPLASGSGMNEDAPGPHTFGMAAAAMSKWSMGTPGLNIDVEVPLKQDAVAQHHRPGSRTTIDSLPSYRT